MNRFDRYTGINWDVPTYIPNYDKLTSLAEEQGKYYKEVQDDFDAITNAAKTATAQVKYINDPSLGDPEVYKNWLANLQNQQNDISNAYQQDYRLGMQKLKEFQQYLHRDLTEGVGHKLSSRYGDYITQMANLQEAKSKGIYKDDPVFADYFMQGAGRNQWVTPYEKGNIGIPQIQGYWTDQDEQSLINNLDKMRPSEQDLLEAVKDDPQALAELRAYKQNYKSVNGTVPFHQLLVDGKISQRTKASLMKFALGLVAPKSNEINFTYAVKNGLDGVVNTDVTSISNGQLSNPLAMYVETPVLDDNGKPIMKQDGTPKTEVVLNNTNPFIKHLMSISEGLAFRNVDFKAEQIKNSMQEFEWKYARERQLDAARESQTRPIVGVNVEAKGGAMQVTPEEIKGRHEALRNHAAELGYSLPKGHEVASLTEMIDLARKNGNYNTIPQLDAMRQQFQRGYAIQSEMEAKANLPSWNEYAAANLGKVKTSEGSYDVQFDKSNGKLYVVVDGRKIYEDTPGVKKTTIENREEFVGPDEESAVVPVVTQKSPFYEARKKLESLGKEWNNKLQKGVELYNSTHRPVLNFTDVTPLQMYTGTQLDNKEHLAYKQTVADGIISNLKSMKNIYAITTTSNGDDIQAFKLPEGAENIQPVNPEQLQFNYNGMDNYQFGSQFGVMMPIKYDIVVDGKKTTYTTTVVVPQTTLDVNEKRQTINYSISDPEGRNPTYNYQAWSSRLPEIEGNSAVAAYKSYNGRHPVVVSEHYDGSQVIKEGGQYWYYDQSGVKRKEPLNEDEAASVSTEFIRDNKMIQQGINPRQTKAN